MKKRTLAGLLAVLSVLLCLLVAVGCTADPTPAETTDGTEATDPTPTEAPTDPATEAPTSAPTDTPADSNNDTAATPDPKGCGSAVAVAALALLPAPWICLRKRED